MAERIPHDPQPDAAGEREPILGSHGSSIRRPDIQALRAIAVMAVFVYHLFPSRLSGGFVGVDVFFVISGFLIAGLLIREAEQTGTIRVRQFWVRRMRRLLPASLLVLAATALAVYAWIPANLWPQFFREIIGATLYVHNWILVADSVDYLAANNAASPVQHFWTLSVEEQFYVFTPLLLASVVLIGRALRAAPAQRRRALLYSVATVTAISFGWSLFLTATSAPQAYFATVTRAWEFGVGALLTFAPWPRSSRAARFAVAAGLVGILTSTRFMPRDVPFPGWIAAWPVLSTAAVIWGGAALGPRVLSIVRFRPLQFLGDISYSVYLWHWPLVVIPAFILERNLGGAEKLAVVGATLLLAALTTRYVEDPIRYGRVPLLRGGSARLVSASAAAMSVVIAIAATGLAVSESRRLASIELTEAVVASHPDCLGAMAIWNAVRCRDVVPLGAVVPDPVQAATDGWNLPECWAAADSSELHVCSFGREDATIRMVAIGDSHSNALLAAYAGLAERNQWRIDVAGHNGCYWTTAVQRKPVQAMVDGCEGWKRELNAWLDARPPYDAILVTFARNGNEPIASDPGQVHATTVEGLLGAWAGHVARGTRIIAIRDNPMMSKDVVTCVVQHVEAANERCSRPELQAVPWPDALVEAAQRSNGASTIDLTEFYCPAHLCQPIIGHVVVYTNKDHVTATWASTLVPILSDRISAALGI